MSGQRGQSLDSDLAELLEPYGLSDATAIEIPSEEARRYRIVAANGGVFSLRVHPARALGRPTRIELEAEASWLEHLAGSGLAVPTFVNALDGSRTLETGAGDCFLLLEWLHGERCSDRLDHDLAYRIGAAIGHLHEVGLEFAPPAGFDRRWDAEVLLGGTSWLLDGRAERELDATRMRILGEAADRCTAEFHSLGPRDSNVGFIHSDPHPANAVLTAGHEIGFIDFAECGFGHPMFDLAALLHELMDDPPTYADRSAAALSGYASVRGEVSASVLRPNLALRALSHFYWLGRARDENGRRHALAGRWMPQLFRQLEAYSRTGDLTSWCSV